jgi:hypothetical protein
MNGATSQSSKNHLADSHNWLVHSILDRALVKALERYAKGVLLDTGCGIKPYRRFTKNLVRMHFGVDHLSTFTPA